MEWLDSGIIDVGFVVKGKADEAFDLLPLMKDKMVVAYHENHRFKQQPIVDMEELADEPFIMPTGMYQSHVEDIFQRRKSSRLFYLKCMIVRPLPAWLGKDLV